MAAAVGSHATMFAGFLLHAVVYVAVGCVLVGVWALTSGSVSELGDLARDPDRIDASFWPVWALLPWTAALVVHLAATLVFGPARMRRRMRERGGGPEAVEVGTAPGPARRWVTVMFTDIVDSTAWTESLGDEAWAELLQRHRDLVRRAFLARGGEEVSTQGDGFLARFATPTDAVLCAVEIQRGVGDGDDEPALRIGIHAGDAVEDDGDLIGRVVNLAARVAAEAEPGEILVTEPVADELAADLALEDRGVRTLKGVTRPRHLLSVRWAGSVPAGTDQPK